MRVYDVQQNGEQWEALRRGLPTASEFHKIVCPSWGRIYACKCGATSPRKRKKCEACGGELTESAIVRPSAQQDSYLYQLIAESFGGIEQRPPNYWMERGHEMEDRAIADYEFLSGNDTERVGFCTTNDGLLGASPDRQVVGKKRWVEAKCPSPAVHIRHLVARDLEDDHRVQVQGQLAVTDYEGVDILSYCPGFPSIIIPVDRDEPFISGMNDILVDFVTRLHRIRAELIAKYGNALPALASQKEMA